MNIGLTPALTPEETAQLAGGNDHDYAVLTVPASAVQLVGQPGGMVVQIAVFLPEQIVSLPRGGVLAADGQTAINAKLEAAFPVPPTVRVVVARSVLAEAAKSALAVPALPYFDRRIPSDTGEM